jgi:hypothetical protein
MNPTVEWALEGTLSLEEIPNLISRQMIAAAGMGALHTGEDGRFWEYVEPLRQFTSLRFPAPCPWERGSRMRRLFVEGASQAFGLHKAATVWPFLTEKVAHEKVSIVLGGRALPEDTIEGTPEDEKNRTARDHLAEFSTAHSMKRGGFAVNMIDGREDVLATSPGCPALVMECKRPSRPDRLSRAVNKAFTKLKEKRDCDGHDRLGAIVICIDRVLQDIPSVVADLPEVPSFETLAEVNPWVNATILAHLAIDLARSPGSAAGPRPGEARAGPRARRPPVRRVDAQPARRSALLHRGDRRALTCRRRGGRERSLRG